MQRPRNRPPDTAANGYPAARNKDSQAKGQGADDMTEKINPTRKRGPRR